MDAVPSETTGENSVLRRRLRVAFLVLIGVYAVARVRNAEYWDPLDDLDLAVHEAGHLVFSAFGETLTILGGSTFQVMVPLAFVAYFVRTKQRYAAAVTMTWVGVNLLNVARYIGDARAQLLPLLGGEDSIHDWWYLLINWDLLPRDTVIARWVHFFGVVAFLTSMLGGFMTLKAQRKLERRVHQAVSKAGRRGRQILLKRAGNTLPFGRLKRSGESVRADLQARIRLHSHESALQIDAGGFDTAHHYFRGLGGCQSLVADLQEAGADDAPMQFYLPFPKAVCV